MALSMNLLKPFVSNLRCITKSSVINGVDASKPSKSTVNLLPFSNHANFRIFSCSSRTSKNALANDSPYNYPYLTHGRDLGYQLLDEEEKVVARVDMPGIDSDDLEVWLEGNSLKFEATTSSGGGETTESDDEESESDEEYDEEEEEEEEDEESEESDDNNDVEDVVERTYEGSIKLPTGDYDKKKARASMRRGVLKVVIPKVIDVVPVRVS